MKSVIGYLLLAIVVATVVGLSIGNFGKPQSTVSGPAASDASSTVPADTTVSTPPLPGSEPLESGCPQEGHIKSPSSFNKATITFDNQTAADLKIYWIDFNGKRKFYETVKAHTAFNQATWVGHVWVVADQKDLCIKLHSANAVEQTLVIN